MAKVRKRTYRQQLPDGSTVKRKTTRYYGYLAGRMVPLCSDKTASETMLADMKKRLEREGAGIIDAATMTAPIQTHLDDYRAHLERQDRSDEYVRVVMQRLEALAKECTWRTLRGIAVASMETWIDRARAADKAPKTINHFIGAAKGFCNWAVERGRLYANPLAKLAAVVVDEVKRPRRAITLDEINRLLAASGPRRLVYWTALATGLRAGELKRLQWGDVRIDDVPAPYIQLRAKATKAKRADAIPLRSDLADALLAARPDGCNAMDRVFADVPRNRAYKRDLERAGIAFEDAEGRRADFHALRYAYCSHLAAAGVNPREAMGLMRHTDMRLTANVYTDEHLLPLRAAVEKLPAFGAPDLSKTSQRATGTDGRDVRECADQFLTSQHVKTGGKPASRGTSERSAFRVASVDAGDDCHALASHDNNAKKQPAVGFEPTTSALRKPCSTAELRRRACRPAMISPAAPFVKRPSCTTHFGLRRSAYRSVG